MQQTSKNGHPECLFHPAWLFGRLEYQIGLFQANKIFDTSKMPLGLFTKYIDSRGES